MKTFYPTLLFNILVAALLTGISPSTVKAQNPIPNPDFEEWSGGEPVGWNTINQSVLGTSFTCVTRDQTNAQHGTSSVKIETVTHNIFLVGPVTMPGILSLGEITLDIINQTGSVEGGVPINTQPNMLRGYFKYLPATGDSCIMGIGMSKWNGTGRDTIAYAYTTIGGQTTDWQEFAIPIEYLIWTVPDTMNIMFFSSNLLTGSPVSGSNLWIDNLWLEYGPVSVKEAAQPENQALVLVNNGNNLTLRNLPEEGGFIRILSLNGAVIIQDQLKSGRTESEINISRLTPGLYIVQVTSASGRQKTARFSRN